MLNISEVDSPWDHYHSLPNSTAELHGHSKGRWYIIFSKVNRYVITSGHERRHLRDRHEPEDGEGKAASRPDQAERNFFYWSGYYLPSNHKGWHRIDRKVGLTIRILVYFWTFHTGNSMTLGFTKGVSVDVTYLKINDFLWWIRLTVNPTLMSIWVPQL